VLNKRTFHWKNRFTSERNHQVIRCGTNSRLPLNRANQISTSRSVGDEKLLPVVARRRQKAPRADDDWAMISVVGFCLFKTF
jgi:hypothetical protein